MSGYTTWVCDRCKAEFKHHVYDNFRLVFPKYPLIQRREGNNWCGGTVLDLCPECQEALERFLKDGGCK